jgi:hypothetical protein
MMTEYLDGNGNPIPADQFDGDYVPRPAYPNKLVADATKAQIERIKAMRKKSGA